MICSSEILSLYHMTITRRQHTDAPWQWTQQHRDEISKRCWLCCLWYQLISAPEDAFNNSVTVSVLFSNCAHMLRKHLWLCDMCLLLCLTDRDADAHMTCDVKSITAELAEDRCVRREKEVGTWRSFNSTRWICDERFESLIHSGYFQDSWWDFDGIFFSNCYEEKGVAR